MFLKYFKRKSIYSSLYSTILLGLAISFNVSESHPVSAAPESETVEDLEQEIDYKKSSKHFGIGLGYALKGNHAKAIENFTKAIAFDPENASAYANRGHIYREKSQWDLAMADYNRAIEITPKLSGRIYFNRGNIYEMRGEFESALADYDMAIERRSSFSIAYFQRGKIYYKQEKWLDGIADFEKVIQLKPDEDQAYFGAGFGYLNLEKWQQGLNKYNQGMLINPDDGNAYFARGLIHANQGHFAKATLDWKKAQKIFIEQKDFTSQKMVEKFLNRLEQPNTDFKIPV